MSTHANIAIEIAPNEYKAIYVHFDGYLSSVGRILASHYKTKDRVEELIKLGNLSSIGPYLTKEEALASGSTNRYGVVEAYHRDRGEDYESNKPFELDKCEASYLYVFKDGAWYWWNEELILIEPDQDIKFYELLESEN